VVDRNDGLNRDEIEAIYRIVGQLEKRVDAEVRRVDDLRSADQVAVRKLSEDSQEKFAGFPIEYGRRSELEAIRETAVRLERDSLSREVYEERHEAMTHELQRRLPRETFESTLGEWSQWRAGIDASMNIALGASKASTASWRQLTAMLAGVSLVIGIIVSLVVLFANNSI
jgi:hypothetical protein